MWKQKKDASGNFSGIFYREENGCVLVTVEKLFTVDPDFFVAVSIYYNCYGFSTILWRNSNEWAVDFFIRVIEYCDEFLFHHSGFQRIMPQWPPVS